MNVELGITVFFVVGICLGSSLVHNVTIDETENEQPNCMPITYMASPGRCIKLSALKTKCPLKISGHSDDCRQDELCCYGEPTLTISDLRKISDDWYKMQMSERRPIGVQKDLIVNTVGVVTADEPINRDVSSGITVFDGAERSPSVDMARDINRIQVGQKIRLTGHLVQIGAGQLTKIMSLDILSRGNTLPKVTIIGSDQIAGSKTVPNTNLNDASVFWRKLVGMKVRIVEPTVVQPVDPLGRTYVVPKNALSKQSSLNQRGALVESFENYPSDYIYVDNFVQLENGDKQLWVATGDVLNDIEGVVEYVLDEYKLVLTEKFSVKSRSNVKSEITNIELDNVNKVTIATIQTDHLAVPTSNEPWMSLKLVRIAEAIAKSLKNPDIVALQGLIRQAHSPRGEKIPQTVLEVLVGELRKVSDADYMIVDAISDVSGPLSNAYIYNAKRVSVDQESVKPIPYPSSMNSPNQVPILAKFYLKLNADKQVTVINAQLEGNPTITTRFSLLCQPWLERQNDPRINFMVDLRFLQVEAIIDSIHNIDQTDPTPVVIVGNLNDRPFSGPIQKLLSFDQNKLTDLVGEKLPKEDQYTTILRGPAERLDYIITQSLLVSDIKVDIVHINSEFSDLRHHAETYDPIENLPPFSYNDPILCQISL